jgi:hypothetical protein
MSRKMGMNKLQKVNRQGIMSDISEKVLALSTQYLGPAARIFLERQTKAHMNGLSLDAIEKKDLPELSRWVNISASLIIDKNKAKDLADKIGSL